MYDEPAPGAAVGSEHFSAEVLFREHGKYVARLLWQLGLAEQDIDDAVQDVFMVAHRRGGFLAGTANQPLGWPKLRCAWRGPDAAASASAERILKKP